MSLTKLFVCILSILGLALVGVSIAHAENDFLCQCEAQDSFGNCTSYVASNVQCTDDSEAVPSRNTCIGNPGCSGRRDDECIVSCTPRTSVVNINYGLICNPNNPNHRCLPNSQNPSAPVSCRQSSDAGTFRCLHTQEQLGNA